MEDRQTENIILKVKHGCTERWTVVGAEILVERQWTDGWINRQK
jgi:hypothetical protein